MDISLRKISLGATFPSEDAVDSSVSQNHTRLPPDDIAIIGMSCRTAGGNDNPEKLWKFLMEKGDASGISPAWRWDTWRHRNPRNLQVIDSTINRGYFINDIEDFDASFFGISPKEAEQMDPQQRMGLELTWEALEDAGVDAKKLARSDTAVFMGVYSDDYSRLLLEDLPNIEGWMGLGSAMHGVANRISYHFDLQGPSAAVDAACASSMVAVDSGRQALLTGQSNLAIVGGVNVALSPAMFLLLQRAGALAPDGVCRSFDDEANGYVRGEGGAVLILKRLTDARADGDNVLCILKASAVAQDGKTNGIMAPNPVAQKLVARKALAQAGLDPLSIGFVEAHATSTSLGDPSELASISAVYGKGRLPHSPALIGSIKPNVGHLEAASGVISLVKATMAVNKGQIPPQANLNKLNVKVDWPRSGLEVVRSATRWGNDGTPRRAAVCSFGYGGTVTHAILEQSTQPRVSLSTSLSNGPAILVLTAPQAKRISAQCRVHAEWIAAAGRTENLQEISSTLARRRAQHDIRAAFVVDDHMDAAKLLKEHAMGEHSDCVFQGRTLPADVNKGVVWLFSGHGAQWTDMGKELVLYPGFLDAISAVERVVSDELGWSVTTALTTGEFSTTEEIQVLTYTTQIGLSNVLLSKGLRPQAVIGHSVGEVAASVAAGCITSEEGATIVARRARLYTQVCGMGGMYLVHVPFEEVATDLAGRSDIVAAINSSPSSCVISGLRDPVHAYASALEQKGVKVLSIKTDVAFHSPMLESLVEPLRVSLKCALRPQQSVIPVYSTSQKDARSRQDRDIDYWVQNMVNPVRLLEAVTAAVADGYRLFVEVSTHPIITHSVNETLLGKNLDDFVLVTTMARHQPFEKSILRSIAQLYVKGADIDFASLFSLAWSSKVPGFAWSRKPFWKHVASPSVAAKQPHDPRAHSLLGLKTTIPGSSVCTYETQLDAGNAPFPQPHMLHGTNILPAAAYVNTFFHAAGVETSTICKIALEVPLPITDKPRTVQVVRESNIVRLFSRLTDSAGVAWVRHASAVVDGSSDSLDLVSPLSMSKLEARVAKNALPIDFATEALKQVGIDGMAFPWKVRCHYSNGQEMLVEVDNYSKAEIVPWQQASWAPTVDAATSISFSLLMDEPKLRIVSRINRITIHSKALPPKVFWLYITETPARDQRTRVTNVAVLDSNGILLVEVNGVAMTEVHGASGVHSRRPIEKLVHRLAWVPARPSESPRDFANAIVISRDAELRQRYCEQLASRVLNVTSLSSLQEAKADISSSGDTAIIYCPLSIASFEDVAASAQQGVCEVVDVVRFVSENSLSAKIFVITNGVHAADSPTALSQAPLYGLARVAAGEHPDIWGGLIDSQSSEFPFVPFRYVQEDVIQFKDGLPWVARLRPLATADRVNSGNKTLLPRPEGTYIVTGGLGDLGLETCDFLIEQGARRLVLISRRKVLARSEWATAPESGTRILQRIQDVEKLGATVHVISLDIVAPDAHAKLLDILQGLSLPPVRGVVHAAGVAEDGLLLETSQESFKRVLSPKVSGTLTLHRAFPPGTLDFFILYSSVGQLIGLSGQSSYASANAFLDCLAEHRRLQGDNTISFLWTAWRSLGMGNSDFIRLACENRGISDIGRNEAFAAWEHMTNYDLSQCVVTPVLACDQDEPVPSAILEDVVERRQITQTSATMPHDKSNKAAGRPSNQAELKEWINQKIRECVASVMKYEIDDIDNRLALSEVGLDSIMSISLRQRLQDVFKIKIPQTLIWNYPTIDLQAEWLAKKMA